MNQQDQIDIIQAHMAGRRVLEQLQAPRSGPHEDNWQPITAREYRFNFAEFEYRIEPRKLELFMSLPSGVLQALGREPAAAHLVSVSNEPPHQLSPGHVIVKIHCTEPES